MWPLKTILYFLLFWAGCVMALVNPIWGVVNYMVVYQINPTNTWWGLPLVGLGIRFSMLAAVSTMLGLFFSHKRVPKNNPNFLLWEVGVLALVAAAAVNQLWTCPLIGYGYYAGSAYAFEKLWKMLLFVLILARLATTRKNLRLVLWTLVGGSLYLGYDAYTAPASSFWLGRLERIGGPDFATTSGTAAHLAAMLPLIGAAFLTARKWQWRAFAAVSGAFTFNAIILCRTRSAFVGLVAGALVAVLMTPRGRRFRIHFLLTIGAVIGFSLTDQNFWNRMETLTDREVLAEDAAAVSRSKIWSASLRILADFPQGIGTGNFPRVIGQYEPRYYFRSTHNTLIVCFTELGVHGGMIFLFLVASSLRFLYLSARLADDTDNPVETRVLVYGFLVALVTYFVTGLGTERFYCESFWWVLVLPLCLYRVVSREATANVEVPRLARTSHFEEEYAIAAQFQYEPR